jgi:hypothetical protein
MPYSIIRGTPADIEDYLNGAYLLGPFPLEGLPVGGLTLIFAQPEAHTITFSGAAGAMRTLTEIVTQINTPFAGNPASLRGSDPTNQGSAGGRKFLVLQDDASGIQITGGTARATLRIPTGGAVTRVPVPTARVVNFNADATNGHYLVLLSPGAP